MDRENHLKSQYKRQNLYIKDKYDRVSITLPAGTKERIKAERNQSINGYVNKLIADDLDRDVNRAAIRDDIPEFMLDYVE